MKILLFLITLLGGKFNLLSTSDIISLFIVLILAAVVDSIRKNNKVEID